MFELLQYEFMRNGLLAAVLVSIACGIVGSFVVVKRIVFISGGISHAAFGGIGLGYWLGIEPLLAVIPFSLLAAVGIGLFGREMKVSDDTAIGVLWTMGMALGILFVQLSPGYAPDLMSYLFGNILTVPAGDLLVMLALDGIILILVLALYREFAAVSFDEEFATVIGMPARALSLLLLCLVALSVVVLIRAVGIILVVALLTMPAAIGRQYTHDLKRLMLLASLIGIALTTAGLWLSYVLDLASGATIILLLGIVFFLSSGLQRYRASSRRVPGPTR
ncbi:MAG: metal ABC transporter permease [Gemmatimonadetes bacterium]|jgi:zinc transport system permease protein|nr:metal ABC transporter permease [Gemmatimonadota bacterium]